MSKQRLEQKLGFTLSPQQIQFKKFFLEKFAPAEELIFLMLDQRKQVTII